MPLPHYYQVLTGVLPHDGSNERDITACIRRGERPSRPTDPTQNRWLDDPVWDVITTCWSDKPDQRCEPSVIHRVFSTSSLQYVNPDKPGDVNVNIERNDSQRVPRVGIGIQWRGKLPPRVASLFQFLRGSEQEIEPEIEKSVGEMDKACHSAFPPPPIPRLM